MLRFTCGERKICKTIKKSQNIINIIVVHLFYVKHAQNRDQFRLRWDNYKSNDRKFKRGEHCMQDHLYEHFYSDDHNGFLKDIKIMLINKTDCYDPKNKENYWVRTLRMLALDGLKI